MVVAKARALGLDQLVDAVSIGYVVLYLIVIALILWRAKGGPTKAIWAALVSVIFAVPIVLLAFESKQAATEVAAKNAEYLAKYEPAKAIFDKLCKEQSAPIIKRTVEDVEGVLLLKVRPAAAYGGETEKNVPDWPEAAIPEFGRLTSKQSQGFPERFLNVWRFFDLPVGNPPTPFKAWTEYGNVGSIRDAGWRKGFAYVDVLQSDGVSRSRYTGTIDESKTDHPFPGLRVTSAPATPSAPRYGVTFEDNLDPALRKHWIAGIRVMVLDTQINEIISEQYFWTWESGFGATGQVQPWSTNIKTCFPATNKSQAMALIYTTLNPKQGGSS